MKTLKTLFALSAFAGLLAGCQTHHEHGHDHASAAASTAGAKPYPLQTCIVSDEKLGAMGDPVVKVYDGQEVKFCCDSCVKDFNKDPKKYLSKLNK